MLPKVEQLVAAADEMKSILELNGGALTNRSACEFQVALEAAHGSIIRIAYELLHHDFAHHSQLPKIL